MKHGKHFAIFLFFSLSFLNVSLHAQEQALQMVSGQIDSMINGADEQSVADLKKQGRSNKEIYDIMFISRTLARVVKVIAFAGLGLAEENPLQGAIKNAASQGVNAVLGHRINVLESKDASKKEIHKEKYTQGWINVFAGAAFSGVDFNELALIGFDPALGTSIIAAKFLQTAVMSSAIHIGQLYLQEHPEEDIETIDKEKLRIWLEKKRLQSPEMFVIDLQDKVKLEKWLSSNLGAMSAQDQQELVKKCQKVNEWLNQQNQAQTRSRKEVVPAAEQQKLQAWLQKNQIGAADTNISVQSDQKKLEQWLANRASFGLTEQEKIAQEQKRVQAQAWLEAQKSVQPVEPSPCIGIDIVKLQAFIEKNKENAAGKRSAINQLSEVDPADKEKLEKWLARKGDHQSENLSEDRERSIREIKTWLEQHNGVAPAAA